MKKLWLAFVGLVAALYLLNPTMGLFELIPDAFPVIGNLDEAGAVILLLAVLRAFGFDLTRFFRPRLGAASKDQKSKTP